jgi:hypothetical protein
MGIQALETDPSIYICGNVIMGVYVDDILICILSVSCNSVSECAKVEVVNKGEVRSFLGISVTRNYPQHAISIGQPGYIDRLIAKYNMMNAKSASTPFEKGTKLKSATKDDTLCNLKMYQELTGSLNHLSVFTRPNIAFAVSKLSKFNAKSHIYTLQSRAACFTMPQINSQLLYCLQTFIVSSDYRHYRLLKRGFRNDLVNSQATHRCIFKYGIGIYGSL